MRQHLEALAKDYLTKLCIHIQDRSVGSQGNRDATDFFEKELQALGWKTDKTEMDVMDWEGGEALLQCEGKSFKAFSSPYSLGCSVKAELVSISNFEELGNTDTNEKIVLLHGEIAKEQLMPKNFIFYNPETHQKIISLLEKKNIAAIITATGRNAALAGGAYPFPLIEDGDFDIPSVFMTEEEGRILLGCAGKPVTLESPARRISEKAFNIKAVKGTGPKRIVITAHIDAKKGIPGAIDNATGVIILLLLARRLQQNEETCPIELVALNGEDYYAVPGQMEYLRQNENQFGNMLMNINIDGAGYLEGDIAFSLFNLPEPLESDFKALLEKFDGVTEGAQWPQGDHSMFVQLGVPAIAVSSQWFIEHMETQDITHTPKDNPDIVDCSKLVRITDVLVEWIERLNRKQDKNY